jgi:hypothetical protein
VSSTAGSTDTRPGAGIVGPRSIVVLLAALVILVMLTFYGIWTFWPAENAAGKTVHVFGYHRAVSRETLFFVVVALSGALGGSVHSLRSTAWYIGNRELKWSWIPFYVLRPLVGATLATVFYLVLRAGLFSPSAQTKATSPYGFAALSALVGLFAEQAVEKLKTVAEQFFQEAPKGADQAPQAGAEPETNASDTNAPSGVVAGAPTPSGSAAVTGDATAVSAAEATLAGSATSTGSPVAFHFEYGTDTTYGLTTAEQPLPADTAGAPVSVTLTGLAPSTLYHDRLVVTDGSGASYGADCTLTTTA